MPTVTPESPTSPLTHPLLFSARRRATLAGAGRERLPKQSLVARGTVSGSAYHRRGKLDQRGTVGFGVGTGRCIAFGSFRDSRASVGQVVRLSGKFAVFAGSGIYPLETLPDLLWRNRWQAFTKVVQERIYPVFLTS